MVRRGGGGKRRRGGGGGDAAVAAAPAQTSQRAASAQDSYARLLDHCRLVRPRASGDGSEADGAEADAAAAAGEERPAGRETGASDGQAAGEEPDEAHEGGDADAADAAAAGATDADDDALWSSAAYDAHFGPEWEGADLDAARAALEDKRWELPGLGATRAVVAAAAQPPAPPPTRATAEAVLRGCGVLPAIRSRWREAHGDGALSGAQHSLLSLLGSYADVHHADVRELGAYESLIPVLALHVAQHITLSQKLLLRHAKKGLTPQDQGFTRPKVLVLLPFKAHALAFVRALLDALPSCYAQVENKARFVSEFGEEEDATRMPESKPDDYKTLFDGNNDDCFRCALRLTRKAVKLFAPFYKADLVIGSPLGLRMAIGDDAAGAERRSKKPRDADWLSSIELAVVAYADVLHMQNWAHVRTIFDALNALPTQLRDTDFSRVRPWFLDGAGRSLRQTVLLSSHNSPELSALFNRGCANVGGRVAVAPSYEGVLSRVPGGVRQLCLRFDASEPAEEAEARLAAFRTRLLPSLLGAMSSSAGSAQTLLYVPQYADFVRLKHVLEEEDVPFVAVSEYSSASQVSKARNSLQRREISLMLYTERAHFFRRHRMGGARHLAVYSPPTYPHFYLELLLALDRSADTGADSTAVLLFSRLDLFAMQRIVGTERAARMLSGHENSFLFR